MDRFRSKTNIAWCGYYLPSPGAIAATASWNGVYKRKLKGDGWKVALLYVPIDTALYQNEKEGRANGKDAVLRAQNEGFEPPATIYLDIEAGGGEITDGIKQYFEAWCTEVAAGGFSPAVYCSYLKNIDALMGVRQVPVWEYNVADEYEGHKRADFDPSNLNQYVVDTYPPSKDCVIIRQFAQNCNTTVDGYRLQVIDFSASRVSDPTHLAIEVYERIYAKDFPKLVATSRATMNLARNRKIALVAIHGISPTQRYATQDLVASQLRNQLQATSGRRWNLDVFFPTVNQEPGAAQAYASALRICQQGDNEENPEHTVFDVYEGYWSPIDKNRTSLRAVLSWLLKSVFVPLNSQTRVPATRSKIGFDLGYAALAIAALVLTGALAFASAFFTYAWLSASAGKATTVSIADLINELASAPWTLESGLSLATIGALLLCVIGGYLLVQLCVSVMSLMRHGVAPPTDDPRGLQEWRMWARIALLLLGGVMIWVGCYLVFKDRPADAWYAKLLPIGFVSAAFFFRGYLSIATDFFVNRFGDIQIYTTRDNNSAFFSLREQILETVQKTVLQVLQTDADAPATGRAYERIYVLGHSLGSTIAMDVLIRLHQLVEGGTLDEDDWRRIRGFVTFGTALEKTRFFFDVQNPTLSQDYQQWRCDVDGHLFTNAFADLAKPTPPKTQNPPIGIFWANYWYEQDIVANKIITYKSNIPAGQPILATVRLLQEHVVCLNVELKSTFSWLHHQWVHSDYLLDDRFWSGVDSTGKGDVGVTEILIS